MLILAFLMLILFSWWAWLMLPKVSGWLDRLTTPNAQTCRGPTSSNLTSQTLPNPWNVSPIRSLNLGALQMMT